MISSIHIKNFRCFRDLALDDLGLINVIVGDNGAGKTALLEAIIMGAGTPELALALKQMRGVQINPLAPVEQQKAAFEAMWNDYFADLSANRVIEILIDGTTENKRKVRIYNETENQTIIPPDKKLTFGVGASQPTTRQVVFESEDLDGHHDFLRPKYLPGGGVMIQGERTVPTASIFLHSSSVPANQAQSVQDFDVISKRKGEDDFVQAIGKVFPQITNLSVIGGELHCSVPEFPEKIPLSFISHGINKLVAIMLGIATRPNGVYMVDEIENGFYYSRMPKIWEAIEKLSETYKVQLFLSSHSKECIQALLPAVERNPKNFRLIRVAIEEKREHTVEVFGGSVFKAVLKTGEVDPRSGD